MFKPFGAVGAAIFALAATYLPVTGPVAAAQPADDSALAAARKARDHSDVNALSQLVDAAHKDAAQRNAAPAYERVALFDYYLCEAGHSQRDDKAITQWAQDGLDAAEKATKLDPNSSEAHRLQGDLLGELIPRVFAGGMRYGQRSSDELDRAIQLDPKNAEALVARAVNYIYTPAMFGGSPEKAEAMLKKAVEADPQCDTAHIWLAQLYMSQGKHDAALAEIQQAQKIDPDRNFAKFVLGQITSNSSQKAPR